MAEALEDNQYLISRGATFDELRCDQKHTDVVIVTTDGSKFQCHKIILIAGCPFFQGLFASDVVESRQNEVNLNPIDISGHLFKQILEYIYIGKIKLNFEDAKAVNMYAGLFTMKNLKRLTEIYLIKNIKTETCLDLWRHAGKFTENCSDGGIVLNVVINSSEKYLNDDLKESCILFATSEVFLDTYVDDLTMEEIKSIVSMKKLNSKVLLKNIVQWIKLDFERRQQHIKDLMELINLEDIKDEKYKRQIFSDDVLMQNNDFLRLSVTYLLRASDNTVIVPKTSLFVVTDTKVFYTNFDTKEFSITALCPPGVTVFGTSSHTTNGFVTTGGYDNASVNLCTQFCPSENITKEFPRLIEARYEHRNYTLGSKIYACGGFPTNSIEIFEENAGRWISGPAMNFDHCCFGAADDGENSLYAVGGLFSKSIEHLDTRMSSWRTIYTDSSENFNFTQSLYKDDKLYSFGDLKGFIFDVRANKMLATIPYKLDSTMDFKFPPSNFDCTIFDDDIWLVGRVNVNNVYENSVIKLNLQTNTWERNNFGGLSETEDLGLVWCRNN